MVSPTAVKQAGEEWGSKVIVGTGPLKFKGWISGEKVILERNGYYKHGPSFVSNKGPTYVDEWIIRFIPEATTLIAELTEGNVDLVGSTSISETNISKLRTNPKTNSVTKKAAGVVYLAINCSSKNPPYNDVIVRQALAHAINKEAVIKAALSGIGDPLYTSIPPVLAGYWKESEEIGKKNNRYDPKRAKELLEKAGWKDTDKDGIREKNGQKLELVFLSFVMPRYKRMAEVVTPMLQDVGFKVELLVLEAGDLYERVLAGKHDLLSTAMVGSEGWAVNDLAKTRHTGNLGTIHQWSHYSNPEMDRLLDLALYDLNPEVRKQALNNAQKLDAEETVVAPISTLTDAFGWKKETIGGVDNYLKHPWALDQVDALRGLELYKIK